MTARILELRAGGMTYAQIAAEVGLSVSRVGELVRADNRRILLGMPDPTLGANETASNDTKRHLTTLNDT